MEVALHVPVKVLLRRLHQFAVVVHIEPRSEVVVKALPRTANDDAAVRSLDQVVVFMVGEVQDRARRKVWWVWLRRDNAAADAADGDDLLGEFW